MVNGNRKPSAPLDALKPRPVRAALVSISFVAMLLGCERRRDDFSEPPVPPERPAASAKVALPRLPRSPDGGAFVRNPDAGTVSKPSDVLDLPTRRAMKLSAFAVPPSRLAFGKGRLGLLTRDALVVREIPGFATIARIPLEDPTALAVLSDGGFFASTSTRAIRLDPSEKKPRAVRRIVLPLAPSVFGDRRYSNRIWALGARGSRLFGYDLEQSTLVGAPNQWVELDGYDHRTMASLRDGSFVYSAKSGFTQFWGPNAKHPITAPSSSDAVVAALPGSRPDTVWTLTTEQGTLSRILAGRLVTLRKVRFEGTPFRADAAGNYLVVLELNQPVDAPWTFVLEVFETSGKRSLHEFLPADEALSPDWLARLAANRELAVTSSPPRIAVGGPSELGVWDPVSGTRIFRDP